MGEFLTKLGLDTVVWVVGLTAIASGIAWWAFKTFLLTRIDTAEEKNLAIKVLTVLDEITDQWRAEFPNSKWVKKLDQLIDKMLDAVSKIDVKKVDMDAASKRSAKVYKDMRRDPKIHNLSNVVQAQRKQLLKEINKK